MLNTTPIQFAIALFMFSPPWNDVRSRRVFNLICRASATRKANFHSTAPVGTQSRATPFLDISLHFQVSCVSLNESKRRGKFRGRRRAALERSQIGVDRAIPGPCERKWLTRGPTSPSVRTELLP